MTRASSPAATPTTCPLPGATKSLAFHFGLILGFWATAGRQQTKAAGEGVPRGGGGSSCIVGSGNQRPLRLKSLRVLRAVGAPHSAGAASAGSRLLPELVSSVGRAPGAGGDGQLVFGAVQPGGNTAGKGEGSRGIGAGVGEERQRGRQLKAGPPEANRDRSRVSHLQPSGDT